MRSLIRLLFVLVFMSTATLNAQQSFPQHTGGLVNDFEHKLTPDDAAKLETLLRDYEKRTTNEIAFVTVPSLRNTMSVEEYANKLFHTWGIGKKGKDNGILFLWVPADRKVRIEVGYGLEGDMPDGRAGQIYREEVLPKFKQEKWAEGVFGGINAIIKHLDSKTVVSVPQTNQPKTEEWKPGLGFWVGVVAVLFVLILVIGMAIRASRNEVPYTDPRFSSSGTGRRRKSSGYTPTLSRSHLNDEVYVPVPTSRSSDSYSSSNTESSSSSFDFGGGDSGGGGASGDY
jgi:uncharacterized protein